MTLFLDCIADGIDGGCKSSSKDCPIVPIDVLADGSQSAVVDQLPGGADEHGRTMAATH